MNLKIAENIDVLNEMVGEMIVSSIKNTLKKQDRFTLVLSGGSTPKKLYQLLASGKFRNKIEWDKLHIFWGDERYVPFENENNNAKMAFEALLNHVPVSKEQIHIIRTDSKPDDSAAAYEKLLKSYFPDPNKTFDMVLLGLGNDAHTLSLFPSSPLIHEKKNWVKALHLKEQKMYRITLTAPVVNAAGVVLFLVSGADKSSALYHVMTEEYNPDLYPAQIIQPYNDNLYWFADKVACADLSM